MKILVSACLLGENCNTAAETVQSGGLRFCARTSGGSVCPEVLGGLPTACPAEIVQGVVTNKGINVDREFRAGAARPLPSQENGVERAILQSRSPSCGVKKFTTERFRLKIPGQGHQKSRSGFSRGGFSDGIGKERPYSQA